jgi:hypothetical protein
MNVTSEAYLSGHYLQINETATEATLTTRILNDGVPALADEFACYYRNDTEWIRTETFDITDFGNGTYKIVFSAQLSQLEAPLVVSINVLDQRGINVRVNATCTT